MADRKTYHVDARRDGRWWFVYVPELDTAGQARKVRQIEGAARDVISLFLNVDPDSFDVEIFVEIPTAARNLWSEAKLREEHAREETDAAAKLARKAVRALLDDGLGETEAAQVLGLSRQRIHQLSATSANDVFQTRASKLAARAAAASSLASHPKTGRGAKLNR